MAVIPLVKMVALMGETAVLVPQAQKEGLEKAAKIIEKEAKRVIGTYDYGWPQLAPSTQKTRESLGFSANEPLLRTGDLRDSIDHEVVSPKEADIGSESKIALYQELGTSKIPPRPFLAGAAMQKGQEVADIIGEAVFTVMFEERAMASLLLGKFKTEEE